MIHLAINEEGEVCHEVSTVAIGYGVQMLLTGHQVHSVMIWTGSFAASKASWPSRWLHLAPAGTLAPRQVRPSQAPGQGLLQQSGTSGTRGDAGRNQSGEMRMDWESDLTAWGTPDLMAQSYLWFFGCCRLEEKDI